MLPSLILVSSILDFEMYVKSPNISVFLPISLWISCRFQLNESYCCVIGCININNCNILIVNCSLKHYAVAFLIHCNGFWSHFHLSGSQALRPLFSFYLCLPDTSFSILLFLTLLNLFVLGVSLVFFTMLDFDSLAFLFNRELSSISIYWYD